MTDTEAGPESLLHYRRVGAGPAVVLLHPIGLDLTFWEPVTRDLAERFTVIAVDLRGHGSSSAPATDYTLEDYADDVHALIDALDVSPAKIVGLSFGGMVAQIVALRHPENVTSLVLCGCPSHFANDMRAAIAERGAAAKHGGMTAVVKSTLTRWFTPDFLGTPAVAAVRQRLLSDDAASWATGWKAISALNTVARLGSISVPVLCVAGEADEAIPVQALRDIAHGIPGATLSVIPGASHMMHIECPDLFLSTIRPFLEREPELSARSLRS